MNKDFLTAIVQDGIEGELLKTVFISLATSIGILTILYLLRLDVLEQFFAKNGFFLLFAFLSYALILPSVRQVRAFREFPCMSGMMIGMTLGMIGGFLPGFFVGATNGMFWGSVFGMCVGIALGVWNGKSCGVMGAMEGMMAGFMGGLMGAMTALMMFNDHLKAAGIVLFCISTGIIVGLHVMIFKETKGTPRRHKDSGLFIILISALLTCLTIAFMVFGPRSVLLQ